MYFNMNGTNKGVDYVLVTLEIQGPSLMPPGLNGNGRTTPGLHGVAATPPGSQMFAHMRSLNNTTLACGYWLQARWRALATTRWHHHQYARWGSSLPLVRCLVDEGRGSFGRCGRKRNVLPSRNRVNKHTFSAIYVITHAHFPSLSWSLCYFSKYTEYVKHIQVIDVNMHLILSYYLYVNNSVITVITCM